MALQVDQVGNLAVAAVGGGIDHQVDPDRGKAAFQRLDRRDRGIVGALHRAQQLHRAAVILGDETGEVFGQARLGAVQGLEQRDSGHGGGREQPQWPAVESPERHGSGKRVERSGQTQACQPPRQHVTNCTHRVLQSPSVVHGHENQDTQWLAD